MCCSVIYEANERPRHATTTVAIRSKPIAPGSSCLLYYVGIVSRFDGRDNPFRSTPRPTVIVWPTLAQGDLPGPVGHDTVRMR